ncbi:MAG UNVERIFIED_CONTAM: Rpn family recombination-promoting nuclease/putative transposase [Rickettsiaceae bacterium]|jgi:predicted transposase/invertase (TIGR01784 family)
METDVTTYEFLDAYLPLTIKEKVDLSKAKVEKESYVEDNLKKRLSDIVYSVPYKQSSKDHQDKIFIYTLVEHQSTPDKWIAFRLLKYMILLMERHKAKNEKLPFGHSICCICR